MHKAWLIFPHQLYLQTISDAKHHQVFFIEDRLFFCDNRHPFQFHKLKLAYHRATMRKFQDDHFANSRYIDYKKACDYDLLFESFQETDISELHTYYPSDFILEKRLKAKAETYNLKLVFHESPGFICPQVEIRDYFQNQKKLLQTNFYRKQRKKLNILMNPDGTFVGGKLTYDVLNRKKLPKDLVPPDVLKFQTNPYKQEAISYVNKLFPNNPGSTENFIYAIDHKQSQKSLQDFLVNRFAKFGPYEDAIHSDYSFVYHAVLSPMLNIGLLTPMQVVTAALDFAKQNPVDLPSVEGFVRQIIGWREFMHGAYLEKGIQMRNSNFFNAKNPLPKSFYTAKTGLPPVDISLEKTLTNAYNHHIERLMIFGNIMCLLEIDPNQVYTWFMEMFIDAYDWVMVPNVYAMSQFADGGILTTKPYISSSNYVLKMSNFKKGPWCEIWDSLYWNFIHKHKKFFESNPRLKIMVSLLEKMPAEKLKHHTAFAEEFKNKIFQ